MSNKIREALAGMLAIVDESRGVDGYHLSGDIAEWDAFPEVEIARAALAQQPTPAAPDGFLLVTPEQVERHATTAWECPPQSRVVLVSTLKRLHTKNTAAPAAPIQADHTALLAELYQILGAHNAGEKVLDQIQAAIAGEPMLHASLLPYEAPAPAAQEPAAFYWQDLDAFPMTARRHGPYFGWPSEDAIARCQHYAKPIPLYAAPPADEQPYSTTSDCYRADLYDQVWSQARLIGFGNVTDALAELQRMKLAEQPDTVAVRELIDLVMRCDITGGGVLAAQRAAHALLGKESEDHE